MYFSEVPYIRKGGLEDEKIITNTMLINVKKQFVHIRKYFYLFVFSNEV